MEAGGAELVERGVEVGAELEAVAELAGVEAELAPLEAFSAGVAELAGVEAELAGWYRAITPADSTNRSREATWHQRCLAPSNSSPVF